MPKQAQQLPEGALVTCTDNIVRTVIHKKTAIAEGRKRFFLGVPCKHGHIHERKLSGYNCIICNRESAKKRHLYRMATSGEYRNKFNKKRNARHRLKYSTDQVYREKFILRAKEARAKKSFAKAVAAEKEKEIEIVKEVEKAMLLNNPQPQGETDGE
jgi:hypothetical protein